MSETGVVDKAAALKALMADIDSRPLEPLDKAVLFRMLSWRQVIARPKQLQPAEWNVPNSEDGPDVWFLLGGRGGGKTRTGAETLGQWAQSFPKTRWCCLAPTLKACRTVMFEGESGLLNTIPEAAMLGNSVDKAWNKSTLELQLRNQTIISGYSSEKPGRLRGPQFHGSWVDEPGELKDKDELPLELGTTYSNLVLGLRLKADGLGKARSLITGTPLPCGLLSGDSESPGLLTGFEDQDVFINRMSSRDNLDNLSPIYRKLVNRLAGTRIGRQEIEAELLTDVPGALWRQAWIIVDDEALLPGFRFRHVVVGVDPAGSKHKNSDETGIIVAGVDDRERIWVLEDVSGRYSPGEWASTVWDAALRWNADTIVFEKNYGGDMGEEIMRLYRGDAPHTTARVQTVSATVGKEARAKPVSLLYEPSEGFPAGSRVRHAKPFPLLTDQLVKFTKSSVNDDRADALVWAGLWLTQFVSEDLGVIAPTQFHNPFAKTGNYR